MPYHSGCSLWLSPAERTAAMTRRSRGLGAHTAAIEHACCRVDAPREPLWHNAHNQARGMATVATTLLSSRYERNGICDYGNECRRRQFLFPRRVCRATGRSLDGGELTLFLALPCFLKTGISWFTLHLDCCRAHAPNVGSVRTRRRVTVCCLWYQPHYASVCKQRGALAAKGEPQLMTTAPPPPLNSCRLCVRCPCACVRVCLCASPGVEYKCSHTRAYEQGRVPFINGSHALRGGMVAGM